MSNFKFSAIAIRAWLLGIFAFAATGGQAQTIFTNHTGEYAVIEPQAGEQVSSSLALGPGGGWMVWSDNAIDGQGRGIGAKHLNAGLSGDLGTFPVNVIVAGDQENPRVTLLKDGGAAFVWQGGRPGFQKIFARFMAADGTFRTEGDVRVNTYTNQHQILPAITCLTNGNVVITWASYGQDGSYLGVYARIFSPSGTPVSSEFVVHQTTALNQSSPTVTGLGNGRFVVAWSGERSQPVADTNNPVASYRISVQARIFEADGTPVGGEVTLSSGTLCSGPELQATAGGGFAAVWTQDDLQNRSNSLDVVVRSFAGNGTAQGPATVVNAFQFGDQIAPHLAIYGSNALVVWTSLGQDGSKEGVFGRYVQLGGTFLTPEFQVNDTAVGQQKFPAVAGDGNGRFLTVWSSFTGLVNTYDLFGKIYADGSGNGLVALSAPYVFGVSSSTLNVSWSPVVGNAVAFYEVYLDTNAAPTVVTHNFLALTNLAASSTHDVRVLYQLTDGRRSALSAAGTGSTWGADGNGDGLPDDWQAAQWGADSSLWPAASADDDGDGASNRMEFLAGTNPKDAASVLKTYLVRNAPGFKFSWNTQPGLVYQVQAASALGQWQDLGWPRFAHDAADSIQVSAGSQNTFYRVIRLR